MANPTENYDFYGSISERTLKNYLARAINHFYFKNTESETLERNKRFILNIGAKLIGRASTMWSMDGGDEALVKKYASAITDIHGSDPDIIFEACIFETAFTSIEQIPIPAFVFEAFGLEPQERRFDYEATLFDGGKFRDHWTAGASVPDMTKLETQMWFYYRAALFIDAGFECLHLGQVHLVGAADKNFECWTKVTNMMRDYAAKKARRGFVLLNAHTHGIIGSDGKLLFDYHRFPIRGEAPAGERDHAPNESEPQKIELKKGYSDSLFGRSRGGVTHSGWECGMLPYLVELDNYGGYTPSELDRADRMWWGMDEISWYANQPAWYRRRWLKYAYKWIREIDGGRGNLELPGTRTAAIRSGDDLMTISQLYYYPYDTSYFKDGRGDEETFCEIFGQQ